MNYLILAIIIFLVYAIGLPLAAMAETKALDDRSKALALKEDDSDLPRWRRAVRRWLLS